MPETCTCGAILVENARFCHRCGRPVFPEIQPVEATPAPVAQTAAPPKPVAPVGFGNPIALRIAFLMSIAIMVVEMIPILQFLFLLWWLVAGWGAVRLYRRITGLTLSISSGARLGLITGVLTFLCISVVMALGMLLNGKEMIQQMIRQNPEFSQVVNNPAALGLGLLAVMIILFLVVVGTCAAGGALSARWAASAGSK